MLKLALATVKAPVYLDFPLQNNATSFYSEQVKNSVSMGVLTHR